MKNLSYEIVFFSKPEIEVQVPVVFCGKCFHSMDIIEWLGGFETDIDNIVPHPNCSHTCNNCGYLWEPSSGTPGDKMIAIENIMFFWEYD